MFSFLILIIGIIFLTLAGVLYVHTHHILKHLDSMLDAAISGNFHSTHYDESVLSRTEQKLSRFLSASLLSRNAIDTDRTHIQALIGDIAHQARTPIANVLLYTGLLAEESLSDSQQALIEQAITQAEKLEFLIDSLVKTSRLESGMVQVCPIYSSLSDLLSELKRSFETDAKQKNMEFMVESCEIHAVFDPKWTMEALGNIIDNAIKYTPAGGSVRVSVETFQLFCAITVEDTGPGIAEHEHAKIFSRFYRSPDMASAPGVGIGLYLAREILQKQNGYIKLSSRPGQGAKFSVFLPRDLKNPSSSPSSNNF